MLTILTQAGLLFVGDSKMSSRTTRAYIHTRGHHYLTPLALVGETASAMQAWIQAGLDEKQPLTPIYVENERGEQVLQAQGYEITRSCSTYVNDELVAWDERVFVVRSEAYARTLKRGLEKRLATATAKLQALTPPRGRGKRQMTEEADLRQAAQAILQTHRVEGLLDYTFERQVERETRYVGRGRGGAKRPTRVLERVRYQITGVVRDEEAIRAQKDTFGWRAYATNVPAERLTLVQAVLTYRAEWLIERGFHRLKGAPLSLNPLFVKRDDQVVGLINLLSLALRLLTLVEFQVRRELQRQHEHLVGLHKENPKKATVTPTTERLLQTFSNITLTIIHFPDRVVRHITPMTSLQMRILELLGLSPEIYRSLAANSP